MPRANLYACLQCFHVHHHRRPRRRRPDWRHRLAEAEPGREREVRRSLARRTCVPRSLRRAFIFRATKVKYTSREILVTNLVCLQVSTLRGTEETPRTLDPIGYIDILSCHKAESNCVVHACSMEHSFSKTHPERYMILILGKLWENAGLAQSMHLLYSHLACPRFIRVYLASIQYIQLLNTLILEIDILVYIVSSVLYQSRTE